MNYFNFTNRKRSSYEAIDNDDDDDDSGSTSSSTYSSSPPPAAHSNEKQQQHVYHHHQSNCCNENMNNGSSNSSMSAAAAAMTVTAAAAAVAASRHNDDDDDDNSIQHGGMCRFQYENNMKQQQEQSPSCCKNRHCRRRRRRRRQHVCLLSILAAIIFSLSVIGVRRHRHRRHSSSTTATKPATTIISHKERLPTFFSLFDGNDYLYALDNPLYIALETATFHNDNNNNNHQHGSSSSSSSDDDASNAAEEEATAAAEVVKITIVPSRIKSHDEPLRVRFFWNKDNAVQDNDVLIFTCGDHADQLVTTTASSNNNSNNRGGAQQQQQYSDILEAATMAQVKTTHQFNIQQQFGSSSSSSQTAAAAAASNASFSDHYEWYIPYLPMIRQPVCHFVLYQPQTQQQQQQRSSNNDDDTSSPTTFATDYNLVASSNILYITSVMEPSMIHLAGTANPTEMLVSFTTGGGGPPVMDDNMMIQHQGSSLAGAGVVTPLAVYSRVHDDINDENDNIIMTTTTTTNNPSPPPPPRTTRIVPNDNAFVKKALFLQDDDNNDEQQQRRHVSGTTKSYTARDLCSAPANITAPGKFKSPGLLHTVTMTDLIPNAKYQYRVGISIGQGDGRSEEETYYWSDYFVFQAAPALVVKDTEDYFEPAFAYLVYGDQGCPREGWGQGAAWTASMVTREVFLNQQQQQPDNNTNNNSSSNNNSKLQQLLLPVRAVHHFGDLSYAQGNAHQWDEWFHMLQPMVARVPFHVAVGNHEYDYREGGDMGKDPSLVVAYDHHDTTTTTTSNSKYEDGQGFHPDWGNYNNDSGGECGVPTSQRFTMPSSSMTRSNGVFWYSHMFASVHTIVLSSENDLDYGSPQHSWLVQELSVAVNRTRTPWLVVEMHRPLYEGEAKWPENNVGIAHRQELEDLFYDYKVDVVFAGHYHAYHRACDGLYRNVCNQGGPLHLTIGTAGGLLDVEPLYKNDWSVVLMENEYGYGRVSVHNRTAMHIEFVRAGALDDPRSGQVLDDVWVRKER